SNDFCSEFVIRPPGASNSNAATAVGGKCRGCDFILETWRYRYNKHYCPASRGRGNVIWRLLHEMMFLQTLERDWVLARLFWHSETAALLPPVRRQVVSLPLSFYLILLALLYQLPL